MNKKTHTELRMAINHLRDEMRLMKKQIHTLLQYDPEKVKKITDVVEKSYNLEPGTVYIKSRKDRIPEARMVSLVLIQKTQKITHTKNADIFNLNHASVDNALKVVKQRYEIYNGFSMKFDAICSELGVVVKL
jgi:chromosomal replication initiation ATPase DnaA